MFGLQNIRNGLLCVTSATKDYPHDVQFINKHVEDYVRAAFVYMSISINSAYAANRHRGAHNEGPSIAIPPDSFRRGGGL